MSDLFGKSDQSGRVSTGKPELVEGLKMKNHYQIAIDGPAGAGKSTVAKLLAKDIKFLYIDSGAMYRAVTLYFIQNNLMHKSEAILKQHLKKIKIDFLNKKNHQIIYLNKKDVTGSIRSSSVNKFVSEVSSKKVVREEMVKRQKDFAKHNLVVMDGRDIGTNVFKDANLKIYLTASSLVRAKRRKKDLEKLSESVSIKNLIKQINDRDNYDSSRKISPLVKAQDAIVIDSSDLTVSSILNKISMFLPLNI